MVEQKGRKRSDFAELDRGIASLIERTGEKPSQRTVRKVRREIIKYLAEGLSSGNTLSMIKRIDDERVDVKILEFVGPGEPLIFEDMFKVGREARRK